MTDTPAPVAQPLDPSHVLVGCTHGMGAHDFLGCRDCLCRTPGFGWTEVERDQIVTDLYKHKRSEMRLDAARSVPSDRPASGLTDPDNAALRAAAVTAWSESFAPIRPDDWRIERFIEWFVRLAAPASVIASHDATTPAGLDDHHHPDTLCPICRYWYAALASPEEPR